MRTIHRAALAAAVVAAAAVVGVGVLYHTSSQDPPPTSIAAGDLGVSTQDAQSQQLREALESSRVLNDDAHVGIDVSLPQALSAGMIGGAPDGVAIDPPHCLAYLSNAMPNQANVSGWLQMGVRPREQGQFSAMVASVPGGIDAKSLAAGVQGCQKGTILLENLGVKGEFTFQVLEGPKIDGAETLTIYSRTSFPDSVSEAELAKAMSCPASLHTVVTEASRACSDPAEVSTQEISAARQLMQFYSMEYYFTYALAGDVVIESCEVQIRRANQVAADLFHQVVTERT